MRKKLSQLWKKLLNAGITGNHHQIPQQTFDLRPLH
jgi:hypothetical protein